MKVQLRTHTVGALDLLIYTKLSRLGSDITIAKISEKDHNWKLEQLDYMMKTIKGAFEFIHYTFEISGVSHAFTHQLVRTRHASYQQESMRAVDKRDGTFNYT